MENGIYIALVSNKFELENPGTWLGGIIQLVTNSIWNHAVLIIIFNQYKFVIHAQAWVRVEMFDDWCKKSDRQLAIYKTLKEVNTDWLFRQVNKVYDVMGLVWQLIFIITGKWIGPTGIKADKFFFCSELAVRAMNVAAPFLYAPKTIPSLVPQGYLRLEGYYRSCKGSTILYLEKSKAPLVAA